MSTEPLADLRAFAFELAGMAKTGLEFVTNEYDRDRFERTLRIAESLAAMTFPDGIPRSSEYLADLGVVTPKAGTAVATFDDRSRILLIRRADNGRGALPGGYAEIGSPPSANALRELREETGFEAEIERLLGVFDNRAFGSTSPYQFYVLLFRGRILRGQATPSPETTAVAFFAREALPGPVSAFQRAMIEHAFGPRAEPVFQ